ncbi:Permease of the drug/metabolite transporter (DMT) superfamily [Aidingimonas halophila]|uniref:Permease of the drug/metabolite transporter (DMT) superfamily n=1 Tax=Aidingimonas halophila TaxID=574349 RepID=A0A1H2Y2I2_9GAMM|nr:Permease of the drug/metabolite transporter (DMT) superfamily [Aidingimonas halophila]
MIHRLSPGQYLIAAGFVVCWSSGFVGARLAMESPMPVLGLFAWRFLLACILVTTWCWLRGRSASTQDIAHEAVIGSLTMGGYLLGVTLAIEFGVSAGITALIAALQPLLAAALAGPWLGERLSRQGWLGMAIATIGVTFCVIDDIGNGTQTPLWAYALPLASVVSVTLGSLLSARRPTSLPLDWTLASQLGATTIIFTVATLIAGGGRLTTPSLDGVTLTAVVWLIVLSSLGGYGFFVTSLRRLGVTLTSTLVYLTPPVTLVWAATLFGEMPGGQGIAGMGIAIVGVGLAIRNARKSDPRHHARDARHAPRTWSMGETRDAAQKETSPCPPHCDSPRRSA